MGHSSIQVTVHTYGYLIPGANVSFVDRLDASKKNDECQQQNATQSQPVLESKTEIPAKLSIQLVAAVGLEPTTYGL